MSQIPMSNEDRINALLRFGYTEREAAFLCLVALQGGYFMRRQYGQFLGKETGGTAAALIEKALGKEHAKSSTYDRNVHVYHLCTRPFYAALGQADNRNRRERQPLTIKNKLMGLDFVLAHPESRFLATEEEKIEYFTRALKLGLGTLPTKLYFSQETRSTTARCFVDKYPIFVSPEPSDTPPVVSFCFVDEGLTTASRFETYLEQYGALFASLPAFHVIYVAATSSPFQWAQKTFERRLAQITARNNNAAAEPSIARMLEHFAMRRQFESKDLASFDRDKLIRFRNERQEFSDEKHEAWYRRWKTGGTGAILIPASTAAAANEAQAMFSTYLLRHNYDLFGSLTAF